MIVDDKGPDVFGNIFDVIAVHGCCNGYEQILIRLMRKKEVIVDENK